MSGTEQGLGYLGQARPNSGSAETNAQQFLVQQLLGKLATTALVKIVAVSNSGGVSPVGTVDVLPLVNQVDGFGNGTAHGTIFGLPYFRLQGGANAVILDPQVGDIGIACFCSRDISTVKVTKTQANPASRRTFDWADGLYIGGVLNGTPTQYVQFSGDGITLTSPTKITLNAPVVEASGEIRAIGEVTAKFGGSFNRVTTHTHPSNGSPPTPGT